MEYLDFDRLTCECARRRMTWCMFLYFISYLLFFSWLLCAWSHSATAIQLHGWQMNTCAGLLWYMPQKKQPNGKQRTHNNHILIRDSRIAATLHKRTKPNAFSFLINIIVIIIKDGCSYYAAMQLFVCWLLTKMKPRRKAERKGERAQEIGGWEIERVQEKKTDVKFQWRWCEKEPSNWIKLHNKSR